MQNVFAADKALPLWDAFDCGRCRGGKNAKTYRETPTTTIGIVFFSFFVVVLLYILIVYTYIFYKHIISFNWKLRCCCPESAWLLLLLLPLSLLPFCFGLFCLAFALCFHFVFFAHFLFSFRFVWHSRRCPTTSFGREREKEREREGD